MTCVASPRDTAVIEPSIMTSRDPTVDHCNVHNHSRNGSTIDTILYTCWQDSLLRIYSKFRIPDNQADKAKTPKNHNTSTRNEEEKTRKDSVLIPRVYMSRPPIGQSNRNRPWVRIIVPAGDLGYQGKDNLYTEGLQKHCLGCMCSP